MRGERTYVVVGLFILITLAVGSGLGLVRGALLVTQRLPALAEDLADLSEGDVGVFLADVLALLVGEEHVCGEATLGSIGVWRAVSRGEGRRKGQTEAGGGLTLALLLSGGALLARGSLLLGHGDLDGQRRAKSSIQATKDNDDQDKSDEETVVASRRGHMHTRTRRKRKKRSEKGEKITQQK